MSARLARYPSLYVSPAGKTSDHWARPGASVANIAKGSTALLGGVSKACGISRQKAGLESQTPRTTRRWRGRRLGAMTNHASFSFLAGRHPQIEKHGNTQAQ